MFCLNTSSGSQGRNHFATSQIASPSFWDMYPSRQLLFSVCLIFLDYQIQVGHSRVYWVSLLRICPMLFEQSMEACLTTLEICLFHLRNYSEESRASVAPADVQNAIVRDSGVQGGDTWVFWTVLDVMIKLVKSQMLGEISDVWWNLRCSPSFLLEIAGDFS